MDPKRKLLGMLARIFSDGVVHEEERAELLDFLASGALAANERLEVVQSFIATTWKGTTADGKVSDPEKKRLREIVRVLMLDPATLPPDWAKLLRDD